MTDMTNKMADVIIKLIILLVKAIDINIEDGNFILIRVQHFLE